MNVAIIDYDMGNLFSVQNAFREIGVNAEITRDTDDIMNADAAVLPGVGAYNSAMQKLKEHGLVDTITQYIQTGKPFMGICLGLQLLFTESEEFGNTNGLGILEGRVVKFPTVFETKSIKVPQIAWNQIIPANLSWEGTELEHVKPGEYMYFVHSFYVLPKDQSIVLTKTCYEGIEYCSSIKKDNIFAVQYHPEKSGKSGLKIYHNFKKIILNS
jgi:glutamine amidotransferase